MRISSSAMWLGAFIRETPLDARATFTGFKAWRFIVPMERLSPRRFDWIHKYNATTVAIWPKWPLVTQLLGLGPLVYRWVGSASIDFRCASDID